MEKNYESKFVIIYSRDINRRRANVIIFAPVDIVTSDSDHLLVGQGGVEEETVFLVVWCVQC